MSFKGKSECKSEKGTLYVVSTPIGNLEDITLRGLRILKEVALIAAESRDHTLRLCRHYDIKTSVTSYNSQNQRRKGVLLLEKLISGVDVALVSDAGTPGLSDPGSRLISQAIEAAVEVIPIPGASAALAALCVSGFPIDRFIFMGFLSTKKGRRRRELERLKNEDRTLIIFESPHRLVHTLEDLHEIFDNRNIALAKEMTKLFEEVRRGPVDGILAGLREETIRGEYTIVVEGLRDSRKSSPDNNMLPL